MTKSQAEDSERLWAAYHDVSRVRQALEPMHFPLNTFEREMVKQRGDPIAAGKALVGAMAVGGDRNAIFAMMQLERDEDGRMPWRRLLAQLDVGTWRTQGFQAVQLFVGGDRSRACAVCASQDGKIVAMDRVLTLLFPSGCSCTVKGTLTASPVIKGSDGSIKFMRG